jgi:RNA polymerase sigma-70 factor (ECF subfamily)
LENLIQRIQHHDKEAFEKLFHEYYNGLCHFAVRFISDRDEAEEIVQDTFVRLWQQREQLHIKHSIKSYLFQSVRNNCLNRLKHQAVVREYEAFRQIHHHSHENEDVLVTRELEDRIGESINLLPPERKRIFQMSRDEGLSYREIAAELGLSVKTVENQIGRALRFLRTELIDFLMILWIICLNHFGGWG